MKIFALLVVATSLLGCGSLPPPNGGDPMPERDEKAREALREHYKSNPPTGRPTAVKPPTDISHPGVLFKDKRHYIVTHDRLGYASGYHAIVNDAADTTDPADYPVANPVPDIMIHTGWLYMVGTAPVGATSAVIAQAEGCTILLYYYTENNTTFHRVLYLEGDPSKPVWVIPSNGAMPEVALSPGTYIDAEGNSNGYFVQWKDGDDKPRVIDSNVLENDWHEYIMAEVNDGRWRYEVW